MSDKICRPPPRLFFHSEDLNSENCNPGVNYINDIFIETLSYFYFLHLQFFTFKEKSQY